MKVPYKKIIDITKPLDKSKLTTWEKISVAIRYKWYYGRYATRSRKKASDEALKAYLEEFENFKNYISIQLKLALEKNKYARGMTVTVGNKIMPVHTESVILSISRSCERFMEDLQNSGDFISYDIEPIEVDSDMVKSFSNLRILVMFTKKAIREDEEVTNIVD
ncbi:MAG: hypothetical protein E7H54_04915 [Clostridium perfringens]|uniref:hypothetical protein n=1 Tax=Clostridium perfringens TaxID=1502 RepID=UPI0024BD5136|nr:hypothetical protein [Clostridium perfringens]MDU8988502.1 hypothetical protein [Clostridium perfringens]